MKMRRRNAGPFSIMGLVPFGAIGASTLGCVDQWLFKHAAHPTLFALVVGLALGTAIIPQIWGLIKPHLVQTIPQADITAGDAFKLLFWHSKLAYDLVQSGTLRPVQFEAHLTESEKMGSRLRAELADRIHNALGSMRLTAWGRIGDAPEMPIAYTEWQNTEIDFSPKTLRDSPSWSCAYTRGRDTGGRRITHAGIRFCKRQLLEEFPLKQFNFRRGGYVSLGKGFDEVQI